MKTTDEPVKDFDSWLRNLHPISGTREYICGFNSAIQTIRQSDEFRTLIERDRDEFVIDLLRRTKITVPITESMAEQALEQFKQTMK